MKRLRSTFLGAVLGAFVLLSTPAAALVWFEAAPGAGDLLDTAQVTDGGGSFAALDGIRGLLETTAPVDADPRSEVDLFKIYIDDYLSFSARTLSTNPDDTALFLFDAAGLGIYTNDDNPGDLLSTLPAGGPQSNGFYYIAVAVGGFMALDGSDLNVFLNGSFSDVLGADPDAGALAAWSPGFATLSESPMAYEIAFTGARVAVPEPGMALMFMLGVGGLLAARRARLI